MSVDNTTHTLTLRKLRAVRNENERLKNRLEVIERAWPRMLHRIELAENVIYEALREAAFCPGCGCDWEDPNDGHLEGCPMVIWRDAADFARHGAVRGRPVPSA